MSDGLRSLPVLDVTEQPALPAGDFSSWLRRIRSAQRGRSGIDVPCGECSACCKSSYFIHIEPDETETLARIPEELLFPAPGRPAGHVVLGYDENGHCPMLVDDRCSIYEDRPRTCRNYDCRIFPAAGITAIEEDKALIARRAARWSFSYPTRRDRKQQGAVRAAARFLKEHAEKEHAECFGDGLPSDSTQLAMLAIKVYEVFLPYQDESGASGDVPPDHEIALAVKEATERF